MISNRLGRILKIFDKVQARLEAFIIEQEQEEARNVIAISEAEVRMRDLAENIEKAKRVKENIGKLLGE